MIEKKQKKTKIKHHYDDDVKEKNKTKQNFKQTKKIKQNKILNKGYVLLIRFDCSPHIYILLKLH